MDGGRVFFDRRDAGRQLAEALRSYDGNAVVYGLPRGGIVVAREVAYVLGAELDVAISCKLRHPRIPEYAVGAVDPDGQVILNPSSVDAFPREAIVVEIEDRTVLARKRLAQYRSIRAEACVKGRTAILVDDGLATGLTMRLAVRGVRGKGAARVVVAVPVAPWGAQDRLGSEVDECVVLLEPQEFLAVGQAYRNFEQIDDEEAVAAFRGGCR